ncbi:MAG: hypothetical protein P1Q69_04640 [Candidatus Thorarchaeota archaeon]|nr:hypothetical protein [Candidatus Thorarchaeota archaeon]
MASRKPILALVVIAIISVSVISVVVLGNVTNLTPSQQLDDAIRGVLDEEDVPGVAVCLVNGENIAWVGC